MRFGSFACALTGVLGLLSPVVASPMPATTQALNRLHIPRTSLTERALVDLDLCVNVAVRIDLNNILEGLKTEVQNAPTTGGGLLGGLLGPGGLVSGVVGGLVGTVADLVAGLNTLIGLNLVLDLGELCLCLDAGVLTPGSLAEVNTQLNESKNSGVLGQVATLVPGIVDLIVPLLAPLVAGESSNAPQCPSFPAGSIPLPDGPTCGSSCLFACPEGLKACGRECIDENATCCPDGQKDCGNSVCVPDANMCPTGGISGRRSVQARSRFACRLPLTACPVSHFLARDGSSVAGAGFECLDTRANIESCGGCVTPFRGNKAGQDCTAIANADGVTCAAGTCIVESCVAGFKPSADASACEAASSGARFAIQGRKLRN